MGPSHMREPNISIYQWFKKIWLGNLKHDLLWPLLTPTTNIIYLVYTQVTQNPLNMSYLFIFIKIKILVWTIVLYWFIWDICNVGLVNDLFLLSFKEERKRFKLLPYPSPVKSIYFWIQIRPTTSFIAEPISPKRQWKQGKRIIF